MSAPRIWSIHGMRRRHRRTSSTKFARASRDGQNRACPWLISIPRSALVLFNPMVQVLDLETDAAANVYTRQLAFRYHMPNGRRRVAEILRGLVNGQQPPSGRALLFDLPLETACD